MASAVRIARRREARELLEGKGGGEGGDGCCQLWSFRGSRAGCTAPAAARAPVRRTRVSSVVAAALWRLLQTGEFFPTAQDS